MGNGEKLVQGKSIAGAEESGLPGFHLVKTPGARRLLADLLDLGREVGVSLEGLGIDPMASDDEIFALVMGDSSLDRLTEDEAYVLTYAYGIFQSGTKRGDYLDDTEVAKAFEAWGWKVGDLIEQVRWRALNEVIKSFFWVMLMPGGEPSGVRKSRGPKRKLRPVGEGQIEEEQDREIGVEAKLPSYLPKYLASALRAGVFEGRQVVFRGKDGSDQRYVAQPFIFEVTTAAPHQVKHLVERVSTDLGVRGKKGREIEGANEVYRNAVFWRLEWAREFVVNEFPKFVDAAAQDPDRFPVEFMKAAASLGLLGMDIPEAYGGSELTLPQQVTVMEELARGDAGLALNILVQNSLTAYPIAQFGTEEQRQRYLPLLAAGELFACFGLTEPDVGSDAKAIKLKSQWVDDDRGRGWVLNGRKRFITSANGAEIMVLVARTGTEEEREGGISTFIVELKREEGKVEVSLIEKMGQEGSQLADVVFDDYFIPESAVLGEVNQGWEVVEGTLGHSRVWIAAQASGIARHAYDGAVKYGQQRHQFGSPLIDKPELINHLANLRRSVDLARLLVAKAAQHEAERREDALMMASLAKLIAGEVALMVAADSMLLHGGMGYTTEMPISKISRDAAVLRIYEGTVHMQEKVIKQAWGAKTEARLELLWPLAPGLGSVVDVDSLPTAEGLMELIESWESE